MPNPLGIWHDNINDPGIVISDTPFSAKLLRIFDRTHQHLNSSEREGLPIDPDGTWIFRTIERAVGKPLTPHLMSAEFAEKFGKSPAEAVRPSDASEMSAISPLVDYLQRDDAKPSKGDRTLPAPAEVVG